MKKILFFLVSLCLTSISLFAQQPTNASHENIDLLRQNGQIYLVVLVLVTIFAGIILLLISIERKLNRLEQQKK